jgi:hypothetical protein
MKKKQKPNKQDKAKSTKLNLNKNKHFQSMVKAIKEMVNKK